MDGMHIADFPDSHEVTDPLPLGVEAEREGFHEQDAPAGGVLGALRSLLGVQRDGLLAQDVLSRVSGLLIHSR